MTKIVTIPVINGLGHTNGCEAGAEKILSALNEIHTNESGVRIADRAFDIEKIKVNNDDVEADVKLISEKSKEIILSKYAEDERLIFLGGDHSMSYSTVKSFMEVTRDNKEEPCLIVFDAHSDLMEPMAEPTHEEWLRGVIEAGFKPANILLIGVRNQWITESDYAKESGVGIVSLNEMEIDLEGITDMVTEFSGGQPLYVSIDIDAIDPAFAPGTGYKEPAGITPRQFFYMISRINKVQNVKAYDLVEINPSLDESGKTVQLGAKILGEIICE